MRPTRPTPAAGAAQGLTCHTSPAPKATRGQLTVCALEGRHWHDALLRGLSPAIIPSVLVPGQLAPVLAALDDSRRGGGAVRLLPLRVLAPGRGFPHHQRQAWYAKVHRGAVPRFAHLPRWQVGCFAGIYHHQRRSLPWSTLSAASVCWASPSWRFCPDLAPSMGPSPISTFSFGTFYRPQYRLTEKKLNCIDTGSLIFYSFLCKGRRT